MPRKALVIAPDESIGSCYEQALEREGCSVCRCEHPAAAVEAASAGDFAIVLISQATAALDALGVLRQVRQVCPAAQVVVVSAVPTVEAAVAAIRLGAAEYLREPCTAADLRTVLERAAPAELVDGAVADAHPQQRCGQGFDGILGQCAAMRDVFALIERIAPADSTVLVSGESGTGKEMVVQAIHRRSRRRDSLFLACDCTALAPTLLESELFGHVKGSFSGAIATKQGLLEVAHHGTLFLDEVANLSLETQGKLLRVLESRRVRKVGDTAEHEIDIRLIAATHRSLAELVKAGAFRADLYYRLNVVPIALPPLRERPGDVPLLATAFLRHFSSQMGVALKGFAREAMRQMEVYSWPGNVRELRNIVERLAVLYGGLRIEPEHLPWEVREAKPTASAAELPATWEEFKLLKRQIVADLERRFLVAALNRCPRNIAQAAENVGMQRSNFHALLRCHGLKAERRPEP